MKPLRRLIALLCLLALGLTISPGYSHAQSTNKAGIVIQFPDGNTQTYCLEFESDTITGLDLLLKTGLEVKVEAQGLGALICSIGATGCDYPAQTCVCQSYGPGGVYWTYHHLVQGRWRASITGAGTYKVKPGDVEGWAWSSGSPPPVYTFNQLCQVAEPPTPTPQPPAPPTSTPEPPLPPTNTSTPQPPTPTSTPKPQPPTSTPQATRAPQITTPEPSPHTSTPIPPDIAATPTETRMPTATLTSTAEPTETPTITNTPTPPATNTTIPTPTISPPIATSIPSIRDPQSAVQNSEDTARTITYIIAGVILTALALWAAFSMTRRRTPPTNGDPT